MKAAAIVALIGAAATTVYACCTSGCYCVKIEPRLDAQCQNVDRDGGASIANWAAAGSCLDVSNYQYVEAFNDGCSSSHVDVQYYHSMDECNANPNGDNGYGFTQGHSSGDCLMTPPGAVAARAICN